MIKRGLATWAEAALVGTFMERAGTTDRQTSLCDLVSSGVRIPTALILLRNGWRGVAAVTPEEVRRGAGGCAGPR